MRIVLLTRALPPRGGSVSTWSFEMARRLARRCDDFAVLGIGSGAAELAHPAAFEMIALRASAQGLGGVPARGLAALRARRFDVVLGADWVVGALGLAWRGRSSVRHAVAAVQDADLDRYAGAAAGPIGGVCRQSRRLLLGRFDAVLTIGARAEGAFDELGGARAVPIGRGCDVERFRPLPRGALARAHGLLERRVLASCGPLIPERCTDKVLFAVSALGVRYPDLCYVIAGEGPERERLELLAERLRIAHRVRFLGAAPEASWPDIYNLCDVFVHLTSGSERPIELGGGALLEAQACGKPLVVTAQAATEERIDGRTAAIVPEDDSTALAEALTRLLDDPERARRLGERGRERVLASATWDLAADRLLAAISRVARVPRGEGARVPEVARQPPSRADAALVER